MKKIIIVFLSLFVFTGCTNIYLTQNPILGGSGSESAINITIEDLNSTRTDIFKTYSNYTEQIYIDNLGAVTQITKNNSQTGITETCIGEVGGVTTIESCS